MLNFSRVKIIWPLMINLRNQLENVRTSWVPLLNFLQASSIFVYSFSWFKIARFVSKKIFSTMAPRKKKEYSNDLREVVIKRFLNGDSEREISCKVLIPRSSVNYMITKYKSMKCIGNIIWRGRKRKTTIHTDRIIQRKIKTDHRKSSTSVKAELQTELNITISETTIRRRAHEIGLYWRVVRKKLYLNKANLGKRLEYARTYHEKPLGFWNNVIWSNESKFNLFGSDGKVMVWWSTKKEFESRCTVSTVKHGGGNVKCCVCFSSSGVGNLVFIDGNMIGELYRDILRKNLLQSAKKLNMAQGLVIPTRQWSEAYGTYCNKLVGPETYTTTQMAFFFSWHESHRTSMG